MSGRCMSDARILASIGEPSVDTSNSKRPGARVLSSFVFWTRRGSSDRRNASHRWATFVRNHAKAVVAADFFNVVLCQNSALLK